MDVKLAIASRRDERRYATTVVPDDVAELILDAGRLAGSSRNGQPWTFVVPTGTERIAQLAEAVSVAENVTSAGLVIALVIRGGGSASFDAGRAAQNMLLAAWNEGLASCPNAVTDQDAAREALETDDDQRVAIVLSFGVPDTPRDPGARSVAEWSKRANRRPLVELVRRLP